MIRISKAKETAEKYFSFFEAAHEEGALDAKTKKLLHIATVLTWGCETWVENQLAAARKMGITEEELAETIQLVASVAAGISVSLAMRSQKRSEPNEGKTLAKIFTNKKST